MTTTTPNNPSANIIDRVKKLLVLGTSSNKNEAENALAAAHSLMQKHRISVAELEMSTGLKEEDVIIDNEAVFSSGRIPGWKFNLLSVIAKHCGCASFKHRIFKQETNLFLVGRKSDVDMAKFMFAYAMNELIRISDYDCKGMQHRYYDSWFHGAVYGISEALKKINAEMSKSNMSTALVLVNNRYQESDDFMRANLKMAKKPAQSNSRINYQAFLEGRVAGNNVDLSNKNKLGNGGNNRLMP